MLAILSSTQNFLTWQTLFYITVCPVLQCWLMLVQLQATLKHAPSNWISLAPRKVKLWETLSLRRVNTQNRQKRVTDIALQQGSIWISFLWIMRNFGSHAVGNQMHRKVIAVLESDHTERHGYVKFPWPKRQVARPAWQGGKYGEKQ